MSIPRNQHDDEILAREGARKEGQPPRKRRETKEPMTLKERVWRILEMAQAGDRFSRAFDAFIFVLIVLNVLAVIFGTVTEVQRRFGTYLEYFEIASVAVFSLEYVARLWACTTEPAYAHPLLGRLRFGLTPLALIDLLAILPFYLPFIGADLRLLRMIRLFRAVKLVRYMESLQLMGRVIRSKKEELIATLAVLLLLLILTSSLMYYVEHPVQPEVFPDIPASMWWAVATLTTVGYGDAYPISSLGKILGSVAAILGIGLFALPTAILGSGFLEELQKRKERHVCPHCGKPPT
jgi:voltage-gated potassium channel